MKKIAIIFSVFVTLLLSAYVALNVEHTKDNFISSINKDLKSKGLKRYVFDAKKANYSEVKSTKGTHVYNILDVENNSVKMHIKFDKDSGDVIGFNLHPTLKNIPKEDFDAIKDLLNTKFTDQIVEAYRRSFESINYIHH